MDRLTTPLTATIRQEVDDFLVEEIDTEGHIVPYLSLATLTEGISITYTHPASPSDKKSTKREKVVIGDRVRPLAELLPTEEIDRLASFASNVTSSGDSIVLSSVRFPQSAEGKEKRGVLRCSIRHAFPNLITDLTAVPPNADTEMPASTVVEKKTDDVMDSQVIVVKPYESFAVLVGAFGEDGASEFIRFTVECGSGQGSNQPQELRLPFLQTATKEARGAFHNLLRKEFAGLRIKTVNGVNTIHAPQRRKRPRDDAGADQASAEFTPKFTHFVLQKHDVDTAEAKAEVGKLFRVAATDVAVAGTKDRRAITSQRISVKGDLSHRFAQLAAGKTFVRVDMSVPHSPLRSILIHSPHAAGKPLHLGTDLSGNRFSIVLRDLQSNTFDAATAVCDRIAFFGDADGDTSAVNGQTPLIPCVGYLNLFGHQRFGMGGELPTEDDEPLVGVYLLCEEYCQALRVLCRPIDHENPTAANVKATFLKTQGRLDAVDSMIPRLGGGDICSFLRLAKTALQKRRIPFTTELLSDAASEAVLKDVFAKVSFDLRQVWMHAVQSLVFNLSVVRWSTRVSTEMNSFAVEEAQDENSAAEREVKPLHLYHRNPNKKYRDVSFPLLGSDVLKYDPTGASLPEEVLALFQSASKPRVLGGLSLDHFRTEKAKSLLGVQLPGTHRHVIAVARHVQATVIAGGVVNVSFQLPTSGYATVFLSQLLGAPTVGAPSDHTATV